MIFCVAQSRFDEMQAVVQHYRSEESSESAPVARDQLLFRLTAEKYSGSVVLAKREPERQPEPVPVPEPQHRAVERDDRKRQREHHHDHDRDRHRDRERHHHREPSHRPSGDMIQPSMLELLMSTVKEKAPTVASQNKDPRDRDPRVRDRDPRDREKAHQSSRHSGEDQRRRSPDRRDLNRDGDKDNFGRDIEPPS